MDMQGFRVGTKVEFGIDSDGRPLWNMHERGDRPWKIVCGMVNGATRALFTVTYEFRGSTRKWLWPQPSTSELKDRAVCWKDAAYIRPLNG